MKKLILLISLLYFVFSGYSQEIEKKKFNINIGGGYYPSTGLNKMFENNTTYYADDVFSLDLELEISTKYKNFNILIGSLVVPMYGSNVVVNGGGVYSGLNTKVGGKHFGANINFAVGFFSFKYNYYELNGTASSNNGTNGIGALSSIGLYFKFWKIGIAPNLRVVSSGSANTSLILIGFNVPITIEF